MLSLEFKSVVQQARYQDLLREASRERQIQSVQGRHPRGQIWTLIRHIGCSLSPVKDSPACAYQLAA